MQHYLYEEMEQGTPRNDYKFVATCDGTCSGIKYDQIAQAHFTVKNVKRSTVLCPDCGYALNWVRVLPEVDLATAKRYRTRVNSPKH